MSAMDSVLTLVNPSPPTELVFNRDSTLDARVSIDARPAYLIATTETPGRFGSRTDIQDLRTEQVVVSIEENPVTPNRIRVFGVNGATTLKVKDWLKKREVEHKQFVYLLCSIFLHGSQIIDTAPNISSRRSTGASHGRYTQCID